MLLHPPEPVILRQTPTRVLDRPSQTCGFVKQRTQRIRHAIQASSGSLMLSGSDAASDEQLAITADWLRDLRRSLLMDVCRQPCGEGMAGPISPDEGCELRSLARQIHQALLHIEVERARSRGMPF